MNQNELCFVHYLSCFLNNKKPEMIPDEWKAIYNLSEINNVTGIIAHEMRQLPKQHQPRGKLRSVFVQTLGATVQRHDERIKAKKILESFLDSNNIDYFYVKGDAVRELYPAPELRTSGDIDVIVRPSKYREIVQAFKKSDFTIEVRNRTVILLNIENCPVEIHNGADVISDYFANSFFDKCTNENNRYYLDEYNQLLYVILHLAKHLKYRGAGIRMLMDIDVCIRGIENFDEEKLLQMCNEAGIEKCAKALLSLINYWFDTPVNKYLDYSNESELLSLLVKTFLHGGTFGFNNQSLGNSYVANASKGSEVTTASKLKGFKRLILPPTSTIKGRYEYADNHPVLVPLGYANRFFDGVFKRGGHSIETAKQIISSGNSVLLQNQILSELEIL